MRARDPEDRQRFSVAYGLSLLIHLIFFIFLFQLLAVRFEEGPGEAREQQKVVATTITLESRASPVPKTPAPTLAPTVAPTRAPTVLPTRVPTPKVVPKATPLRLPRPVATLAVSFPPTVQPTVIPSPEPTLAPTVPPATVPPTPRVTATPEPTPPPTAVPTRRPTASPTPAPTPKPATAEPSPSQAPTVAPTLAPTAQPTLAATVRPTAAPTAAAKVTVAAATAKPAPTATATPTLAPTAAPTLAARTSPPAPSAAPSVAPNAASLEERMRKMLGGINEERHYDMKSYAEEIAEAQKRLASNYEIAHMKPPPLKGLKETSKAYEFDLGQILYAIKTIKVAGFFEICAGWLVTTRGPEQPPAFYVGPCKKNDDIADPRYRQQRTTYPTPPPLHN